METDALLAMYGHIENLDILPTFFPNAATDTRGNQEPVKSHCRVFVLPVDADNSITTCGQKARYRWLMQVSVFVQDGEGSIKASQYIDRLRAGTKHNQEIYTTTALYPDYGLYPSDELFVSDGGRKFRVVGVGNTAPAIQQNGWFSYPLTFTIEIIE